MAGIKREWVRLVKNEPKGQPWKDTIVYFIQCQTTMLIKIGFAGDPMSRLSNLQCGSPTKLRIVAQVRKPQIYEKELHEKFAAHRRHGEWFFPGMELLEFIEAIRAEERDLYQKGVEAYYAEKDDDPQWKLARTLEPGYYDRYPPLLRPITA